MIAIALEAALAFNLACSGMTRTGPVGLAMPEESGDPVTITYRVDIDAGQWCSDACGAPERLEGVLGGVIVLRDSHDSTGGNLIMIHPANSTFSETRIDGNTATLISGTCRVMPFTGFSEPTV